VSMAVRLLNFTIQPMNDKFCVLLSTDVSSKIYSISLSICMCTSAFATASFYIPTSFGIRDDMMGISWHVLTPYGMPDSK
jgi:hypothetical protein